MGVDFVGNPYKVDYDDIDDIGADSYSDDENFQAFSNDWGEVYESSDYDNDDADYDPAEDFLSDYSSNSTNEMLELDLMVGTTDEEYEDDVVEVEDDVNVESKTSVIESCSDESQDPGVVGSESNT